MKREKLFYPMILLLALYGPVCFCQEKVKTVLALGDSLSAGYGVSPDQSYLFVLSSLFKAQGVNLKVINASIAGATSAGALKRLKWAMKEEVDLVILALGSNDALRGLPVESCRKNLEEVIIFCKEKGVKVLLAGSQAPPNYGKEYSTQFEAIYKDLASKHKLIFMPFILKDVAGRKELNQEDQIHPNKLGHEIMAKNFYEILKESL